MYKLRAEVFVEGYDRKMKKRIQNQWKKYIYGVGLALVCAIGVSLIKPNPVCAEGSVLPMTLYYDGKEHAYNAKPITLKVNQQVLTSLPMSPILLQDRTLSPAREVFEALGAVVDWKPESKEVFIGYDNKLLVLQVDNPEAEINGVAVQMEVPPKIINDKTMVPLRFAAQSLNLKVHWDDVNYVVSVDSVGSDKHAPDSDETSSPPPLPTQTPVTNTAPAGGQSQAPVNLSAPIPEQNNPEAKIVSIGFPEGESASSCFTISASSAITKVETLVIGTDRVAVDIYNAAFSLSKAEYVLANNPKIGGIRSSQNQVSPMVTRVVFDLKNVSEFNVSLSDDRKTITVNFGEIKRNAVGTVNFTQDSGDDVIFVGTDFRPAYNAFTLTGPNRLVVDVSLADVKEAQTKNVGGAFAASVQTAQFDPNTARVVVQLTATAQYSVSAKDNGLEIRLFAPTYQNLAYDAQSKTLQIKKDAGLAAANITQTDNYNGLRYVLSLPMDYKSVVGYGILPVGDNYLNAVQIETNSMGQTDIILDEKMILAYTITEDNAYIYVKAMLPKEKYDKIVILDPGHGLPDVGTSGYGLLEKDINYDVSQRLKALLEQDGRYKVYMTRNADVKIQLNDRVQFANGIGDIFISIHTNYVEGNANANGIETYYYPHDNDNTIGLAGTKLAEIIHRNVLQQTGVTDRKVRNDQEYVVIKNTKIPAVLIEMGYLSNASDASLLASDIYRQNVAQGLMNAIIETFTVYTPRR